MGSFSTWLCSHRWDGPGSEDAHECSKCGQQEPHAWQYVARPATGEAGQGPVVAPDPVPMRLYVCKVCGATKWRKSPLLRTEDYLA